MTSFWVLILLDSHSKIGQLFISYLIITLVLQGEVIRILTKSLGFVFYFTNKRNLFSRMCISLLPFIFFRLL